MSERTACGAAHETHGRRTNVSSRDHLGLDRAQDLLLAPRAGEVVLVGRALVLAGARERERLLAVDLVLARAQAQRVAAVASRRR